MDERLNDCVTGHIPEMFEFRLFTILKSSAFRFFKVSISDGPSDVLPLVPVSESIPDNETIDQKQALVPSLSRLSFDNTSLLLDISSRNGNLTAFNA